MTSGADEPQDLNQSNPEETIQIDHDNTEYTDIPEERKTWREMNKTAESVSMAATIQWTWVERGLRTRFLLRGHH